MSTKEMRVGIRAAIERSPHRAAVRSIALFGSRQRGDAAVGSDVDLLIKLRHPISFFALMDIENALTSQLHCRVDLRTPHELSKYFRQDVADHAHVMYEG